MYEIQIYKETITNENKHILIHTRDSTQLPLDYGVLCIYGKVKGAILH